MNGKIFNGDNDIFYLIIYDNKCRFFSTAAHMEKPPQIDVNACFGKLTDFYTFRYVV